MLRRAKGMTQEDAAAKAHLDPKHFQAIEAGRANLTMASLVGIAHSLGVRLSELFSGV
jgi:transcriptional regulator with XRE-family HTH domain